MTKRCRLLNITIFSCHMIADNLTELGLSAIEAQIFELLIDTGPCHVAPLVQKSKKHRQIVYNALEQLEKKKLVVVSKRNGKNFYQVGDPDRFSVVLQQNLALSKHVATYIKQHLQKNREIVEYFSGSGSYLQGLADFRRHAEEAKEYIVIGGEEKEWYEYTKNFFAPHVEELQKMKRRGVDVLILFYEPERKSAEQYIKPYLNNPYICKIADNRYRLPQTSWLAGNYIYLLTPTNEPLVVSIKSQALSQQYREYFWEQWKNAQLLK